MAVIPQYTRQIDTPMALNAPKQSLNAPIEAFGGSQARDVGGMGDVAGKLGNAMAQIAVQQKDKENKSALNTAVKQYLDWDRDYQETVYAVKGQDANVGLVTKAKDDRNAKIEELAGSLGSPELGKALQENLLHVYNSSQTLTARHVRSQMDDWAKKSQTEVAQGHLDSLMDSAPSMTPEEVEAGFDARVLPEMEALARLTSTPVSELTRKGKEHVLTSTVRQAIATGDKDRANALLARWSNDIPAEARGTLTEHLRKKNIEDAAEDMVIGYYKGLQRGTVSAKAAEAEIEKIGDDDLRRTTRRMFEVYHRQWKSDHAIAVGEEAVARVGELDGLAGDLPAMQKLVQNYSGDKRVKTQMETRLRQYKSANGMRPMTDAEAYADITNRIIAGDITAPAQIDTEYAATVEKSDREELKRGLGKMQTAATSALKVAFTKANGIEGGVEASLSDSRKKNFGEFLLWAGQMAKDTNRVQEPEYFQKLADMWVLQGEKQGGGWSMGMSGVQKFLGITDYGENMTFQDAVKTGKASTWLPVILDKETASQVSTLFAQHPTVKAEWVRKYGSEDLAARAYYKAVLMQGIGPRSR